MDRKQTGTDAERTAETYLQAQGLQLIMRNARCRMGEIDLVMQEGDTLVFVEVRKRRHSRYGGAAQSVDLHKQRKLIQTVRFLFTRYPQWSERPCRFDVIAFESDSDQTTPLWYKDAFRP